MTKHRTTALGLTAGLVGGAAAGLLLGVPALTSASGDRPAVVQQTDDTSDDTTTDDTTTDDTSDDTTTDDTTTDDEATRPEPQVMLRESLQALVDDGTITADQADAVAAHLAEQLPERGPRGGHHGRDGHHGRPGFDGEVVADLLGIDVAELRSALRDGQSIADLAEANGVDVQTIIDALVAEVDAHLDQAVTDGRLTQDEADQKLAEATERITDMVDRSRPVGD